jgi:dethiobiotin synthetase
MPGLFVTGTDTGVGKTFATAALLHAMTALGLRTLAMKPIAAGADLVDGAWLNEDVATLKLAANVSAPRELINPYLFREPLAPHIAADHKGVRIEIPRIVDAYSQLTGLADWVLVEGVGGFRVPLDNLRDTADLAIALDLPIVLVVGMRLGCINHALLTFEAIEQRGLRLAGWIANRIDHAMAAFDENLMTLQSRLPAPCLAVIPYLPDRNPEHAARLIPPKPLMRWFTGLIDT